MTQSRQYRVLVISQVYPPDPASVGQHMSDAAVELARRGWDVTVFTSARGYADPSIRYDRPTQDGGVGVRSLPLSSFGKESLAARAIGGTSFLLQTSVRALLGQSIDAVLVSTTTPLGALAALFIASHKKARLVYWVMDLNPDQAIALGMTKPGSLPVRIYNWANRRVLSRAEAVVAMDRPMAARLKSAGADSRRLHIIAPWAHDDRIILQTAQPNPFRAAHGLDGKFVVMYSGNHSTANPLRTVIEAALALRDDPRFVFVFVGEGGEKQSVLDARSPNIMTLPYQPLASISDSLSAADLHVVTMGNDMVGIVHPCKVYGAFAAARPVLFIGPDNSHIADLLREVGAGWRVAHGDVDGAVAAIRSAAGKSAADLLAMGLQGRALVGSRYSQHVLCGELCDLVTETSR